jgi:DNA-binding response OmpR family regulator
VFILLVEDSPADAGLIRGALEEHGVEGEVLVIGDGEKAIQFIQAIDTRPLECPDLVIVDLNLPKRPGREVLEFLRRSEKCRSLPVIVLSSSDAAQDRADAARFGATRYLKKPLLLKEFLNLGAIFKEALRGRAD